MNHFRLFLNVISGKSKLIRRNLNLVLVLLKSFTFTVLKETRNFTALKGNDLQYNYYLLIINSLKVV